MVDRLSRDERSQNMSRIKSRDSTLEMRVRRYLHAQGLRYRLHDRNVPGHPDLVFRPRRIAVFVHGCFWHRHQGCKLAYNPKSNSEFWQRKFETNIKRDAQVANQLAAMGWKQIVIWECGLDDRALKRLYRAIITS